MARRPISGGIAKASAKRITARQKIARVKNIAVARMHKRKSLASTEAAAYLSWRGLGKSKSVARKLAIKEGKWAYKRLFGKKK